MLRHVIYRGKRFIHNYFAANQLVPSQVCYKGLKYQCPELENICIICRKNSAHAIELSLLIGLLKIVELHFPRISGYIKKYVLYLLRDSLC